ncbi:acyl-CoA dehydrogenase [Paraburkholderia phenoliruptrix]|uniref:acyl-CoA dehydrogenase n=1 Tax=Paraburkholderia phenoliruptrix TaxID=252970 RepID=UPI001C6E6C2F|nr:acyl-CoA dehydrogenase [Paraburkholderia phenoliruptrix]MBW9106591.1 acyl-CoA dehydrogenase [Paraburkholderia phenoliruptrix]MBW9131729.1 acyl-CoA dehydrogenase [Paraburkholderia ginsengiterrae]
MDFQPDPGLGAFRAEVRAFLREHLPRDLAGKPVGSVRSMRPDLVRWQKILNSKGWGAPYWAKKDGGTGWSVLQRLVFDEECMAAGAPTQDGFAQKLLGPVLNEFASEEQKAAHVPHILNGERLWCQGFSEPGSGSDLASLRTRAERDADSYVVNGQKIWTSYAHESDWIFLLVRTDTEVKKQAGISFLLVDIKTPGITVRPIRSIDDCHHLNETFFDNVRVPVANRVGAEGDGWKITKFLLNNEHASAAELPLLRRYLMQLRKLATVQRFGGEALIAQPAFALRLARLEAEVNAIAMMVQRVAAMEQDHSPAAHALGSILKVRGTELQQRMSEFMVEALGDYGAVAYPEPHDPCHDEPLPLQDLGRGVANEMFFRRASTIYGGTSEVQRGIIAKMLFQL